jgi:hypothetical protein
MSNSIYTRRNFLSSVAILASATLIARSPAGLLTEDEKTDIEGSWKKFMQLNEASAFLNVNNFQPEAIAAIAGQRFSPGAIVAFDSYGLLAQPTFIYWDNSSKPADIVIRLFENSYPYDTIKTFNRFETEAFNQLAKTKQPAELIRLACSTRANKANRMLVKTTIKKRKQLHEVTVFENNQAVFNQQLFYNI